VTRSVLDVVAERAAAANAEVRVVDTSGAQAGGGRSGLGYHVRRARAHLTACRQIAAARCRGPVSVYLGGAGGLGLWYQLSVVVVARLLSARVFFHHHSYSYLVGPRSRVMQWLSTWMGARGAHVFLSDGMAGRFGAVYRSRSAALVVSNAAFVESDRRPRRRTSTTFRLIHVSNLTVEKGSVRVMEAFERLRYAGIDVSLTLIGGTTDPRVVETVARLRDRHPDTFRSLGQATPDDIAYALDESDLFLFPSTYRLEAQPLVVLEALARGVPVLANDRGTMRDLLPVDWLLLEGDDLERRIGDMIGTDWMSLSARAAAAFEDSRSATMDLAGSLLGR
jgi:glycosyltransferase involved in cell wall biosynthesis